MTHPLRTYNRRRKRAQRRELPRRWMHFDFETYSLVQMDFANAEERVAAWRAAHPEITIMWATPPCQSWSTERYRK